MTVKLPIEEFHTRQAANPRAIGQMYRKAQREWLASVEVTLARFPLKDLRLRFKPFSGTHPKGDGMRIDGDGVNLAVQFNPDYVTLWVSGMVNAQTLHYKAMEVGHTDPQDFAKQLYLEIADRVGA